MLGPVHSNEQVEPLDFRPPADLCANSCGKDSRQHGRCMFVANTMSEFIADALPFFKPVPGIPHMRDGGDYV